jgi:AcrR family transcriptional regulator/DNA-binding MarR family transcriptional regulator
MQLAGDVTPGPLRRPGPRHLPREDVLAIQRDRLLAATVTAVAEVGFGGLTVGRIVSGSRVSRNTFYGIFEDREDCFCATFVRLADHARGVLRGAYGRETGWRDGVRAALAELLRLMDDEPGPAKLCVVDALAAGDRVLERRAAVLEEFAIAVDGGRAETSHGPTPPEITARGVVAGITGLIHAHLVDGCDQPLTGLHGQLMYMIVSAYLGAEEASKELDSVACRAVRPRPPASNGLESALEGLSLRLTYRTVRVLGVIALSPGASNREVAAEAGVLDQGQISKLLHRLAGLGLVENRGMGELKRAANSWHLTRLGAEVLRTMRPASRV